MRRTLAMGICCSLLMAGGCSEDLDRNFKQDMREFVRGISSWARSIDPGFIIIPQNGQELVTADGNQDGPADPAYLAAIDGIGREDLFYGYATDNAATPAADRVYMTAFLDTALGYGVTILVTDYCWDPPKVDDSYAQNAAKGYVPFAADSRDLNTIPAYPALPHHAHDGAVTALAQARNFLYLIDPTNFGSKDAFVAALDATSYDAFIVDLYFDENTPLTPADVEALSTKPNGAARLVICYMSIGEAENYRYYWKSGWEEGSPAFLEKENPDWAGNYKVRYWVQEWQDLIYGSDSSYLKKIMDAGFDGVYLDIIDAFEYFEEEYGE